MYFSAQAPHECIFKDDVYVDGEGFFDPDDPCVECYCQAPEVFCHVYECDEDSCNDPLRSGCCKSCSGKNILKTKTVMKCLA